MSEYSNEQSIKLLEASLKDLVENSLIIPPNMVPISQAEYLSSGTNQKSSNKKPRNQKLNKNYATKTDQAQSNKNNNLQPDLKQKSINKRIENRRSHKSETLDDVTVVAGAKNDNKKGNKSNMKNSYSTPNMQNIYDDYWPIDKVKSDSTLIQGKIRINQRSYEDAFITDPNGGGDIYINGLKDRNRALNNDIVAIKIKEKFNWRVLDAYKNEVVNKINEFELKTLNPNVAELFKKQLELEGKAQQDKRTLFDYAPLSYSKVELLEMLEDNWFQKTGYVVHIIEKKHNRIAAGHLKLFPDKGKEWVLFSPNDSRLPRIKIKLNECPPDFYTNSQFYANSIFIARIKDIPINSRYAIGELKKTVGKDGDVEAETEAILIENGIDYSEFNEDVNQSLPKTPWMIPNEEYTSRRDLRNLCIFTIDPATARDLDDALHVIKLNEDLYEVGVHIADVSYFVPEDSPIDKCASERTTSVYLVQKVIPMLPRLLCEQLCSLNPSVDRLTFSVIWKIKSNGDVIDEWFGRTVINSAVKLSYEHAQKFIENPNKEFTTKEFPEIRSEFCLNDIKTAVLNLNDIAVNLRSRRFANGCLALNQPKINFVLNKECNMPYGYNIYKQKDSNKLVEEFMLLANIAVAHQIYKSFPDKAVLRRHPAPNSRQIEELEKSIRSNGYECDLKNSGSIQALLHSIKDYNEANMTLTTLLTKTMQLALYFCSGYYTEKEQFRHYALAVPLYTHFTSPIRRYPDVLVHRLLAASLGYAPPTQKIPAHLNFIADNCNDKKYSARICSERSSEMFFSLFVNECGPFDEVGSVIQINDHSFDVLIVNLGIVKRIYCEKLAIVPESFFYMKNENKSEISFTWEANDQFKERVDQNIKLFSIVNVVLIKHDNDKLKFNVLLKHPRETIGKPISNKLIVEEINPDDQFYNQQFDSDPYILD